MTVQNTNRKDVYLTNGTTVYWPYTFEIFTTDGSDLALYETNLTTGETKLIDTNLTRDIINSRIKYPRTGSPRPAGYKITVARVTERTQGVDLETQSFDPKNMERGLDKLTAMVQEIDETVSRAAVADISQQGASFTFPSPVGGKVIGWNAEGTGLINLDNTTLGIEAQMLAATEAAQDAADAAQDAAEAAQTAADKVDNLVSTAFESDGTTVKKAVEIKCNSLPKKISSEINVSEGAPSLVQLASGLLLVAFQKGTGDNRGICITNLNDLTWERTIINSVDERYPHIIKLSNGDLICAFETAEETPKAIKTMRSTNNGETWGEKITVYKGATYSAERANMIQLANGELICAFRTRESFQDRGVACVKSANNGLTWGSRINIYDSAASDHNPSLLQLPSGKILCAFVTCEDGGYAIKCVSSVDNGATWNNKVTIVPNSTSMYAHPTLALAKNGELLCGFYVDTGDDMAANLRVVKSYDLGKTWNSYQIFVFGTIKSSADGKLFVANDGTIYFVFHTQYWDESYDAVYLKSIDNGNTWFGDSII